MPFAGYLVYEGSHEAVLGSNGGRHRMQLGSLVAYEIGYYGGRPLVERYGRWILMGVATGLGRPILRALGIPGRFFGRLLPVIRTFIALPAGVARMPRGRFHIYTFLGSWPWCLALA